MTHIKNMTQIHYYDDSRFRIDFSNDFHIEIKLTQNPTMEEVIRVLEYADKKYKNDINKEN